jgi:hypothetical protein
MGRSRLIAVAIAALVALTAVTGCSQSSTPQPTTSSTSAMPTSTSTPDPTYTPGGSAQSNKGYFDLVNRRLLASNGAPDGRALIDNLVSAGFDKAAMQVTPDKTSINGGVDSILFSVKMGDGCLLGQNGSGGYSSAVEVVLANGSCLVGKTRTINW